MIHDHIQGHPRQILKVAAYGIARIFSVLTTDHEYVFVLSHMRSGSSLLTHILVSNPDILGYGETMTRYTAPRDFDLLALKIWYTLRQWPFRNPVRYLLDKLLHNVLLSPEDMSLLFKHQVRLVFLFRDPGDTLSSLVRSLGYTPARAIAYLTERLDMLHQYVEQVPSDYPAVTLTYRQLVYETPAALEMLRSFLDLRVPLSEDYRLLKTTGMPGIGDFSSNIRTGRIVRQRSTTSNTLELFAPELIDEAYKVWAQSFSAASLHTKTL